jgi:serine/threonine protein phosphatase PrpC
MNLSNKISAVELTDVGQIRDHNEDAIGSQRDAGLYVLADGWVATMQVK